MSEVAKFAGANLPAVTSLTAALRSLEVAAPSATAILKMDRTGHWVFGADQTEVESDSLWAVNPFSFVHGFIAWGDGEVLAEVVESVTKPLPQVDVPPPGAKKGWETQVGMGLQCLTGEDKGMDCRYTATSVGGKRFVQALAAAIAEQVERDPSKPVPLIKLGKDHYQHKSYGRIYTPAFEVVKWVGMDGKAETEAEAEAPEADEPPAAPQRRRRMA